MSTYSTDWSVPVVTTVLMMCSPDPDPPTLTNTLMQRCVATRSWPGDWCSTDGKVATIHHQLASSAPPPRPAPALALARCGGRHGNTSAAANT